MITYPAGPGRKLSSQCKTSRDQCSAKRSSSPWASDVPALTCAGPKLCRQPTDVQQNGPKLCRQPTYVQQNSPKPCRQPTYVQQNGPKLCRQPTYVQQNQHPLAFSLALPHRLTVSLLGCLTGKFAADERQPKGNTRHLYRTSWGDAEVSMSMPNAGKQHPLPPISVPGSTHVCTCRICAVCLSRHHPYASMHLGETILCHVKQATEQQHTLLMAHKTVFRCSNGNSCLRLQATRRSKLSMPISRACNAWGQGAKAQHVSAHPCMCRWVAAGLLCWRLLPCVWEEYGPAGRGNTWKAREPMWVTQTASSLWVPDNLGLPAQLQPSFKHGCVVWVGLSSKVREAINAGAAFCQAYHTAHLNTMQNLRPACCAAHLERMCSLRQARYARWALAVQVIILKAL